MRFCTSFSGISFTDHMTVVMTVGSGCHGLSSVVCYVSAIAVVVMSCAAVSERRCRLQPGEAVPSRPSKP